MVAADLIDDGETVFAYTFAAPATTDSSDNIAYAVKYDCIYNIINTDDFIAYFPLEQWGFKRYGQTGYISVNDNYYDEWLDLTNKSEYHSNRTGVLSLYEDFYSSVPTRNSCYTYDSGFVSDRTSHAVCVIRAEAFPDICEGYYEIYSLGMSDNGDDVLILFKPLFIMKVLADYMASDKDITDIVQLVNASTPFLDLITQLVTIKDDIYDPHRPETYYLLASELTYTVFN